MCRGMDKLPKLPEVPKLLVNRIKTSTAKPQKGFAIGIKLTNTPRLCFLLPINPKNVRQ